MGIDFGDSLDQFAADVAEKSGAVDDHGDVRHGTGSPSTKGVLQERADSRRLDKEIASVVDPSTKFEGGKVVGSAEPADWNEDGSAYVVREGDSLVEYDIGTGPHADQTAAHGIAAAESVLEARNGLLELSQQYWSAGRDFWQELAETTPVASQVPGKLART